MIRADGIVKVLDFGIAKLAAAPLNTEGETLEKISTRTKTRRIARHARLYVARTNSRRNARLRVRIFSVSAVCLYEMLTGGNPFHRRRRAMSSRRF